MNRRAFDVALKNYIIECECSVLNCLVFLCLLFIITRQKTCEFKYLYMRLKYHRRRRLFRRNKPFTSRGLLKCCLFFSVLVFKAHENILGTKRPVIYVFHNKIILVHFMSIFFIFRPKFHLFFGFYTEVIRKLECYLTHTVNTMCQLPVVHVYVKTFACILQYYIVTIQTAFTYTYGSFCRALSNRFLWKFLYNRADLLFFWLIAVHLKMDLKQNTNE
jgi:hypothetical protein